MTLLRILIITFLVSSCAIPNNSSQSPAQPPVPNENEALLIIYRESEFGVARALSELGFWVDDNYLTLLGTSSYTSTVIPSGITRIYWNTPNTTTKADMDLRIGPIEFEAKQGSTYYIRHGRTQYGVIPIPIPFGILFIAGPTDITFGLVEPEVAKEEIKKFKYKNPFRPYSNRMAF